MSLTAENDRLTAENETLRETVANLDAQLAAAEGEIRRLTRIIATASWPDDSAELVRLKAWLRAAVGDGLTSAEIAEHVLGGETE